MKQINTDDMSDLFSILNSQNHSKINNKKFKISICIKNKQNKKPKISILLKLGKIETFPKMAIIENVRIQFNAKTFKKPYERII